MTSASTILTNNDNQNHTTTFESLNQSSNQSLVNKIDDNEIILIDLTNDDLIVPASAFQINAQNSIDKYDDVLVVIKVLIQRVEWEEINRKKLKKPTYFQNFCDCIIPNN